MGADRGRWRAISPLVGDPAAVKAERHANRQMDDRLWRSVEAGGVDDHQVRGVCRRIPNVGHDPALAFAGAVGLRDEDALRSESARSEVVRQLDAGLGVEAQRGSAIRLDSRAVDVPIAAAAPRRVPAATS